MSSFARGATEDGEPGPDPSYTLQLLFEADRTRLRALGSLDDTHADRLALLPRAQSGTLEHRRVDENVLAAGLWRNEAEALVRIIPFHRAHHLDRGTQVDLAARGTFLRARPRGELGPARRGLLGRALIDRDHLVDLAPLGSLAHSDPQRGSGADGLMAGGLQGVHMQEHVARAI